MTSLNRVAVQEHLARTWPLLLTALLVTVIAAGGDTARDVLRYDRSAVDAGVQWWRLLSGHLVHLGLSHTLLNLAGLALVILLFPREYTAWQWWLLLLGGAAGISAGFVLLRVDLVWYVGLSGILHGLFAAGAVRWIRVGDLEGYALALFLVGKLAWEQWNGALPLSVSTSGGPVVVDAHLYGAVIGTVFALVLQRDWRR
ncbi:MAG: rhombosortase [Gammaproteobacteria bacterium]|nr:rhombosortase [Gammaproteobacteria bacterium]NNF61834.1 rhombosortase [Gammaproteobacteria bacterium]